MEAVSALLGAGHIGSRVVARVHRKFVRGHRAVVVPPAGEGSLGDAAMLNATCSTLRSHGVTEVDLLLRPGWGAIDAYDRQVDGNAYFYGGGRRKFLPILASLGRYSHAYFVGADVLDGTYNPASVRRRLSVLAEVAAMGGEAKVLGSSFSETPHPDSIAALRSLPRSVKIKARDPLSQKRMEAHLDRPIELVADLAFLLEAQPDAAKAVEAVAWMETRRRDGDRVVALNANYLIDAKHVGFSAALGPLAKLLLAKGISLLMVPHDTRTDRSDEVILKEAAAHIGPDDAHRVRFLDPDKPEMIKAVLGAVDLVVTGRMHVAILAMGAGRPALSFGYQGKFEGLYQMLGLSGADLLQSPLALVADIDAVAASIVRHLDESDGLAAQLVVSLPEIRRHALANFAGLT